MKPQFVVNRTLVLGIASLAIAMSLGCGGGSGHKDAGDGGPDDAFVDKPSDSGGDVATGDADGSVDGGADGGGAIDGSDGAVDSVDGPMDGAPTDGAPTDGAPTDGGTDAAPPAELTATILNRRQTSVQLAWGAPAVDGGAVAAYQVRYAKVPITSANFDDTAISTPVTFTGAVGAPGHLETFVVSSLYIENDYYFAVAATDSAGNRVWMQATSTPVIAHFLAATLTGTTGMANEGAGIALDGAGDANGDGKSDLLIGTANGARAYLFFGAAGSLATAPSVVFSGAQATFGGGVGYIGDVDHDGREDLAIGVRGTNQILIYKGRATWPPALADTDADYTITGDATYASSQIGAAIARLGDFNGDGIDDFAVGAPNFGGSPTFKGRVLVVLGAMPFSSVSLPSTTRTIVIDGDPALSTPFFGTRVVGLGHFYANAGATLVASAPGVTSSTITSNNEGHIYAFRGQAGTAGIIAPTAADAVVAGATAGMRIGSVLANLGPIAGSLPSVGSGNPNDATVPGGVGSLFVYLGSATGGPFAASKTLYLTGSNDSLIGAAVIGGGVSGRDASFSLIGSSAPDVVVAGRNGTDFVIVDGTRIAGLSGATDARTIADVVVPYPNGFGTLLIGGGTLIPDVDGDGFADLAFSNAASNNAGQVVVLR